MRSRDLLHSSDKAPGCTLLCSKPQLNSSVPHTIQKCNKVLTHPSPTKFDSRRYSTHHSVSKRSLSSDRHEHNYICQSEYSSLSQYSEKELKILIIDTIITLLKHGISHDKPLINHHINSIVQRSSSDEDHLFAPRGAIYQRHQTHKDAISIDSLKFPRSYANRREIALSRNPELQSRTERKNRNDSLYHLGKRCVKNKTELLPGNDFKLIKDSCLPNCKLLARDGSTNQVNQSSRILELNCLNNNKMCDTKTRKFYEHKSVLQSQPIDPSPSVSIMATTRNSQTHPKLFDMRQSDQSCKKHSANYRSSKITGKKRFQVPAADKVCDKQSATFSRKDNDRPNYHPVRYGSLRYPSNSGSPLVVYGRQTNVTGPLGAQTEEADCCLPSADPLLYGDGCLDCTIATVLVVLTTLMVLAGVVLTSLHYAAGIEFNTENRGRVVGPVLLGLSAIPMMFTVLFACRARERVIQHVEQQKLDYSALAKISYKQNQVSQLYSLCD